MQTRGIPFLLQHLSNSCEVIAALYCMFANMLHDVDCLYLLYVSAFTERFGGSHRRMSVAVARRLVEVTAFKQWQASLRLKEHFWRLPARAFWFARGQSPREPAWRQWELFFCHMLPMAPLQQTPQAPFLAMLKWGWRKPAWEGSVYWCDERYFIQKVHSIDFWKVVLHKSNIRCVERNLKACRSGGTLSLSTFIRPWISDYSQDYTVDISKITSNLLNAKYIRVGKSMWRTV